MKNTERKCRVCGSQTGKKRNWFCSSKCYGASVSASNEALRRHDIDALRAAFHYDQDTGLIYRKSARGLALCGKTSTQGYTELTVQGRVIKAHRLAWALVHGSFPDKHIDHINGIKTDNRLCNLRLASRSLNAHNIVAANPTNTRTGVRGVTYSPRQKKFVARIRIDRALRHLGYFSCVEDAQAAYMSAKLAAFPELKEAMRLV